jgi:hypothetical protein
MPQLLRWERGTFRFVVLLGPWAIKVPRLSKCADGAWCNREEMRISAAAGDARFCPVLWASRRGWWLVMRRATPLTGKPTTTAEIITHVQELMSLQDDTGIPVEDAKAANLGMLGDQLVIFDYAGLPPHAKRELEAAAGAENKRSPSSPANLVG